MICSIKMVNISLLVRDSLIFFMKIMKKCLFCHIKWLQKEIHISISNKDRDLQFIAFCVILEVHINLRAKIPSFIYNKKNHRSLDIRDSDFYTCCSN